MNKEQSQISKIVKNSLNQLLLSYSSLLFMRNKMVGLVLLLTTFLNLDIALSGLVAIAVALLFAAFIHIDKDDLVNHFYGYNTLLIGLSAGFLFRFSPLSVLLIFGLSVLAFLFTYFLTHTFNYYLKLPVLNIPFTIVSTIMFLASGRYSSLFVTSLYQPTRFNIESLPEVLQGLLRACGVILFMPYDLPGLIILVAILLYSRIAFFLTIISYFAGVLVLSLLKGNFSEALASPSAFNFILTGVALGGIFLIPAKRTYLISLFAVLISVFIIDAAEIFWSAFKIPILTLPFNVVVLLFLYTLTQSRYPRINYFLKPSPELSLLAYLNQKYRFKDLFPKPNLPVFGEWTIYQAFDGQWTHKGLWRYALDFVITDSENRSYKNDGLTPEDYYAFGKPIVSPINGYVVDGYDQFEDQQIGVVDKKNNWGNYLIIRSDFGYFVELSHLKKGSICAPVASYVTVGQKIAECGNSGYSPEPHLHLQVQYQSFLGAPTVQFYLSNAQDQDNKILNNRLVKTGCKVKSVSFCRITYKKLQFILDDKFSYNYLLNGKKVAEIELFVSLDSGGFYYFGLTESEDRLYFKMEDYRLVFTELQAPFNSVLKYLFMAAPSIYLFETDKFSYKEYLPDYLVNKRGYSLLVKSLFHNYRNNYGNYSFVNREEITGEIGVGTKVNYKTTLKLDDQKGFLSFSCLDGKNRHEFLLVDE